MEYEFSLRNMDDSVELIDEIPRAFDNAISSITSQMEPGSLIGASFSHPDLNRPILISFRPSASMTGTALVNQIEQLLNSNETVNLEDHAAIIRFVTVKPPQGGTNHRRH